MLLTNFHILSIFIIFLNANGVQDSRVVAAESKHSRSQTKVGFERSFRHEEGDNGKSRNRDVGAVRMKVLKSWVYGISGWKNLIVKAKPARHQVEATTLHEKNAEWFNEHNSLQQSFTAEARNTYTTSRDAESKEDILSKEKKRTLEIVCPKYNSCRDRCHNNMRSVDNQTYNCYCDDQCYLVYKDCCYDYEQFCGKQQYRVNNKQVLDQSMVTCVPGYEVKGKSIWMVTKCPRGWSNKETLLNCQYLSSSNMSQVYQFLPVIDENNTVYRNVFCAQCNNIENFEYFSLNITCPILPPSSLSSLQEMISFVLKYCGHNDVFTAPYRNQPRRYCSNHVHHSCQTILDSEKCTKGPVAVVKGDHVNFKNVWCAQCHRVPAHVLDCGLEISRRVSPYNTRGLNVPSFSIIMDTADKWRASSSAVFQTCPAGEIFDPFLQICRRGQLMPPVKDLVDKYRVVMWLKNLLPSKPFINNTEVWAALATAFDMNETQIAFLTVHKLKTYYIVEFEVSLTSVQSLTVSILPMQFTRDIPRVEETLSVTDLLHFTRERIVVTSSDIFTVFKVTFRRLACIGKESYTKEEYIVLKSERYHIISTNQTLSSNDVYPEGSNITVCNDLVSSTCEGLQLYLKPEEYTKFPNLSVFYQRSRTFYNIGEYRIENDTLILCTNALLNPTSRGYRTRQFCDMAMEILTILTFTLSLVSLAVLIFTYIIYSELRKLPGKNLLNLAVSLFLAQLLWLLGVPQTKWRQFCTIITFVEHYLFLVTFTAMSVIAFHTKIILASKKLRRPSTLTEDRKRFMIYSTFVWGVPLVFVSIAVLLHENNIYDSGYSSEQERIACWIATKQAQEFLFVLPVGILLFFNTAMFIYTIVAIHLKRRSSRELFASKNKQHEQNAVWIYLKLSSLTGLTWIFGFLDILVDSTTLFSVLFVLFASLQGFYIALSFLKNGRVAKLYREFIMRLAKTS